jgi:hypothetical protein
MTGWRVGWRRAFVTFVTFVTFVLHTSRAKP